MKSQWLLFIALTSVSSSWLCKATTSSTSSSCGSINNISCPFYLKGHPHKCTNFSYELSCENNLTIIQVFSDYFYVEAINYANLSIRIVDSGLARNNYSCSSIPLRTLQYTRSVTKFRSPINMTALLADLNTLITYIDCTAPVMNSTRYIPTPPCLSSSLFSYVVIGYMDSSDVYTNCTIQKTTYLSSAWPNINKTSFFEFYDMAYGMELPFCYLSCLNCYSPPSPCCQRIFPLGRYCEHCNIWLWLFYNAAVILAMALVGRCFCGIPFVCAFLVYKLRRRHLSVYDNIEDFLQERNNLMPLRYTYSHIKKITKGFSDRLGGGGFGTVYKGKLQSGLLVAVKLLNNTKTSGQDFINEVGTIGRIHHVNIVRLVGFCVEGQKQALIYEYMPNGSLDKYIFHNEDDQEDGREGGTPTLSCEKIYDISCKVACGIEYLHRGCDMQILHFDIKPHNILLDENFNPKISDFGLAKLRATDDSIVTMTAARGTMGYMAPELFYKNIGGVSYKADVYSFGMLLMEMAGERKNLNPFVDQISQIYFPSWIYDQISKGKEIEMEDATENERELVKKMIIVAMWCIQMKPSERPSMNKVIEMLEEKVEHLVMPPKPLICPQEAPIGDHELNRTSN